MAALIQRNYSLPTIHYSLPVELLLVPEFEVLAAHGVTAIAAAVDPGARRQADLLALDHADADLPRFQEMGLAGVAVDDLDLASGGDARRIAALVPQAEGDDAEADGATVTVTGLLRLSEPGGAFLRKNQPEQGRWYSRDVQAIAAKDGLGAIAPYFIDAADTAPADGRDHWPRGGLTVTTFRNSHLSYLLTWYGLALLVAYGAWRVAVDERRVRLRYQGASQSARDS